MKATVALQAHGREGGKKRAADVICWDSYADSAANVMLGLAGSLEEYKYCKTGFILLEMFEKR